MSAIQEEKQRYKTAVDKYDTLLNKYTGEEGWKTLNDMVGGTAEQLSKNLGSLAGNQAQLQARNSGMSKSMAAMLAAQQGAKATQDNYGNLYGNILQIGQKSLDSAIEGTKDQRDTAAGQRDKAIDRTKGTIADTGKAVGEIGSAIAKAFIGV